MGEEATATVTIPSLVHTNVPASSSSTRFLGLLKQLDSEPIPSLELDESDVVWSSTFSSEPIPSLELDESDVVWSSTFSSASSFPTDFSPASHSPPDRYRHQPPETRPFVPERSGLSAALADDSLPLVRQRRPAAAAAEAARGRVPVPSGRAGAEEAGGRMGKGFHHSAPVNVPAWPSWRRRVEVENWEEEREEEDEGEERLPPHVIVARTRGMTFSVFEGAGRTLKGRDLRQVRNSVLRKTGFL